MGRFQYQSKADPLQAIPPLPAFGWYVQQADRRRTPRQNVGPSLAFVAQAVPPLPAFGWYVQQPDPRRCPERNVGPALAFADPAGAATATPFDWCVQNPGPMRPRQGVATDAGACTDPAYVTPLDWLTPQCQPPRLTRRPMTGAAVYPPPNDVAGVPFDWVAQSAQPVRPRRWAVAAQAYADPAYVTPFDWAVQGPQPPRGARRLMTGANAFAVPDATPVATPFDWCVPQTHRTVRPRLRAGGFFAFAHSAVPPLPVFDWYAPQSYPTHRARRPYEFAAFAFPDADAVAHVVPDDSEWRRGPIPRIRRMSSRYQTR